MKKGPKTIKSKTNLVQDIKKKLPYIFNTTQPKQIKVNIALYWESVREERANETIY